ncbi:MAG: winged helix-turn-helix domain-containing protein [Amaricoccus sp.]
MGVDTIEPIAINGVIVDFAAEILRDRTGRRLELRPQSFAVLRYLAANAGRLVTKDELAAAVWPGLAVTDDSLVQCVHEIRRALGDATHAVIRTVPRRGYRFAPSIAAETGSPRRLARLILLAGVAAMALAGGAAWWARRPEPASSVPLVAVLPFEAASTDERSRLFASGLTKDLIADLGRFPQFDVLADGVTAAYGATKVDPRRLGEELGASFVVAGSIADEADRVRVTAQLVDAGNGRGLWADRWDRPTGDLFEVQAEIAETIANRLGGGEGLVEEDGRLKAHRKPTRDLDAYELYLLGTARMRQITRSDMEAAVALLERAVARDPGFARAWIELHHAYRQLGDGFGVDPTKNRELAEAAATRALDLDPGDPEAHLVMGWSLGSKGAFVRAKAEFDTALAMAPNAADVLTNYADWAAAFGEPERGGAMADRVIRLEPNFPVGKARDFAYVYFMAGRYAAALRMIDRLAPENYWKDTWAYRAGSLAMLGRIDEARAVSREAAAAQAGRTIEVLVNDPGYGPLEHRRFLETLPAAGFPACAPPGALDAIEAPVRLPQCAHADGTAANRLQQTDR